MPDLMVLAGLVARLESWLKWLSKAEQTNRVRWKQAVARLQEAVIATQNYVSSLNRNAPRDLTAEKHLSQVWQIASAEFYGIDGPLAERLQLKAEYWTQPEEWSDEDVTDTNISLNRVAEYTRQLLRES